mmetsp:Transcript_2527/g.7452  ORF Transcript_2527/g.7452 Transcript_2527/m.7452 type:complete len:253 (-) Transcript_2527:88-846(-)
MLTLQRAPKTAVATATGATATAVAASGLAIRWTVAAQPVLDVHGAAPHASARHGNRLACRISRFKDDESNASMLPLTCVPWLHAQVGNRSALAKHGLHLLLRHFVRDALHEDSRTGGAAIGTGSTWGRTTRARRRSSGRSSHRFGDRGLAGCRRRLRAWVRGGSRAASAAASASFGSCSAALLPPPAPTSRCDLPLVRSRGRCRSASNCAVTTTPLPALSTRRALARGRAAWRVTCSRRCGCGRRAARGQGS